MKVLIRNKILRNKIEKLEISNKKIKMENMILKSRNEELEMDNQIISMKNKKYVWILYIIKRIIFCLIIISMAIVIYNWKNIISYLGL